MEIQDFSDGPVVKTSPSNEGVAGSIPAWGTKIPHAIWHALPKIKAKKKRTWRSNPYHRKLNVYQVIWFIYNQYPMDNNI